jgi:Tfp pilus assembly protein PilF
VLIGQVYQERMKDDAKAKEYYEKALALNPDDPRIVALVRGLEKK